LDDREARELVGRVDASLERIEALPDSPARAASAEALQGLLELYGEGFARVAALVAKRGGAETLRGFAEDELLSHLLLLHGLHPDDIETRVEAALEGVRPYLATHGGNVELLGVADGVVHVRLQGSCDGCPSSAMTLKSAIEAAVLKAAPDVVSIEAEGVAEPPARPAAAFIPLSALSLREKRPPAQPTPAVAAV